MCNSNDSFEFIINNLSIFIKYFVKNNKCEYIEYTSRRYLMKIFNEMNMKLINETIMKILNETIAYSINLHQIYIEYTILTCIKHTILTRI